jgi:hypothetical protein
VQLRGAGKAQAEERVRELESLVGELLRAGESPALWRAMEELRLARQQLESLAFQETVADLRAHRRPKATSKPAAEDEGDEVSEGDRTA